MSDLLTETERASLLVGECGPCAQGTLDVEPCRCAEMLHTAVESILRARLAESECLLRMTTAARDRAERTVERVEALAETFERDDRDYLDRSGQHLMGGAVLFCAEHLRAALNPP